MHRFKFVVFAANSSAIPSKFEAIFSFSAQFLLSTAAFEWNCRRHVQVVFITRARSRAPSAGFSFPEPKILAAGRKDRGLWGRVEGSGTFNVWHCPETEILDFRFYHSPLNFAHWNEQAKFTERTEKKKNENETETRPVTPARLGSYRKCS